MLGDKRISPRSAPQNWTPKHCKTLSISNGWGLVARHPGADVYVFGSLVNLLRKFCTRRGFINFLEIAAQVIAVVYLKNVLPDFWISFIDNQAGRMALLKGHDPDACIDSLLAFIWSLFARVDFQPHFDWVKAEHNVSDKV